MPQQVFDRDDVSVEFMTAISPEARRRIEVLYSRLLGVEGDRLLKIADRLRTRRAKLKR